MPISRSRIGFRGPVPFSVKFVFAAMMVNFLAEFALFSLIPQLGRTSQDPIHSYLFRLRGGTVYFVRPVLAMYLEAGFALQFLFLAVLAFLFWLYRDQIERYNR